MEESPAPDTSGWKEDTVAVGCGYQSADFAILCSPSPGTLLAKGPPLRISGHTPLSAEFGTSGIIYRLAYLFAALKFSIIIYCTI